MIHIIPRDRSRRNWDRLWRSEHLENRLVVFFTDGQRSASDAVFVRVFLIAPVLDEEIAVVMLPPLKVRYNIVVQLLFLKKIKDEI